MKDNTDYQALVASLKRELKFTEDMCVAEMRKLLAEKKQLETINEQLLTDQSQLKEDLKLAIQLGESMCAMLEIGASKLGPKAAQAASAWRDYETNYPLDLPQPETEED